jgi:hypothetical protein
VHFVYQELAQCTIPMGDVDYRPFNLDPTERFCVAALARTRGVKRVFEFGTYDGSTALLLARSVDDAEVFTLDLPPDEVRLHDPVSDHHLALAGGVGSKWAGQPESARITQLFGDSRSFDFTPYTASMDLVLVDGGHSYGCVRSDSVNALRMLSRGGIVLWDDYSAMWPEVVRAVDDVASERAISVTVLGPTELAAYDASKAG